MDGPASALLQKILAVCFMAAVLLVPVAIVALAGPAGGVWVAGYVFGIVSLPFMALIALRAVYAIVDESYVMRVFIAYCALVFLVSLGAALYAWALD